MTEKLVTNLPDYMNLLKDSEYIGFKALFQSLSNEENFLKDLSNFLRLKAYLDDQYSKNIVKLMKVFGNNNGFFDFTRYFCVDYLKKMLNFYQTSILSTNKMLKDIGELSNKQKKKLKSKEFKELQYLFVEINGLSNMGSNIKKSESNLSKLRPEKEAKERKKIRDEKEKYDGAKFLIDKRIESLLDIINGYNNELFTDLKSFIFDFLSSSQSQIEAVSLGMLGSIESSSELSYGKSIRLFLERVKRIGVNKDDNKLAKNQETANKGTKVTNLSDSNTSEIAASLFDTIKNETANDDKFYSDGEEDEEQTSKFNIVIKPASADNKVVSEEELTTFAANLKILSSPTVSSKNAFTASKNSILSQPSLVTSTTLNEDNFSSFSVDINEKISTNTLKSYSSLTFGDAELEKNLTRTGISQVDEESSYFNINPKIEEKPKYSIPISNDWIDFDSSENSVSKNALIESTTSTSSNKSLGSFIIDCPVSFAFFETVNAELFEDQLKDDVQVFGSIFMSLQTVILKQISERSNLSDTSFIFTLDYSNDHFNKLVSCQQYISLEIGKKETKYNVNFTTLLTEFKQNLAINKLNGEFFVIEVAKYMLNASNLRSSKDSFGNHLLKSSLPIKCALQTEYVNLSTSSTLKGKIALSYNPEFIPKTNENQIIKNCFHNIDINVIYQITNPNNIGALKVISTLPKHESWDEPNYRLTWFIDKIYVNNNDSTHNETIINSVIGHFYDTSQIVDVGLRFKIDGVCYTNKSINIVDNPLTNRQITFSANPSKRYLKSGRYVIHEKKLN